jgi:hypothetical protein
VAFGSVIPCEYVARDASSLLAGADCEDWLHTFDMQNRAYSFSDEARYLSECEVSVLADVTYRGDNRLVSDSEWQPLADVLALFPARAASATEGGVAAPRPRFDRDLIKEHPWLLDFLQKTEAPRAGGDRDPVPGPPDEPRDPPPALPIIDDLVDEEVILDLLAAKRKELRAMGAEDSIDFTYTVLGGKWTKEHAGVAYDAYRAEAKSKKAKAFMHRYYFVPTASFHISLYSEPVAIIMVSNWIARMQYFLDVWSRTEDDVHVFSLAEVGAFRESEDFQDVANTASGRVHARVVALRALVPRGPR